MKMFDTIAAIATPVGIGGIAIIRISGETSEEIASKIAFPKCRKPLCGLESHKLYLSEIRSAEGSFIDEVLLSVMHAPNSYTGETVVEINCHGGYLSASMILEELFRSGARQAEAGEFTRRAFINGKTDLTRAEAVIDLIHAGSALGHENAAKTLSGKLYEKVNAIRQKAVSLAANLSAIADFPDEIDEMPLSELKDRIGSIESDINEMLSGFQKGRIMRDGVKTVIIGRPNVGKSSLLNALSRSERAIVTDIPGTTRDTVEEYINIKGLALKLIDTAGIRQSDDGVEKIGIEKAYGSIKDADLCLFVADASQPLTNEDLEIFSRTDGKNIIAVINKTDKAHINIGEYSKLLGISENFIVETAAPKDGECLGIEALEDKIYSMFMAGKISKDDVFISNDRQKNALIRAKNIITGMLSSLNGGTPQDLLYIDLEDAVSALGEITGATVQDEIIDEVFERFCVGK